MAEISVGMLVRYAKDYCTEGERKYLHVVKENRLNPVTGEMSRWLIETINTEMAFNPTEVVERCMIEPTGFSLEDFEKDGATGVWYLRKQ